MGLARRAKLYRPSGPEERTCSADRDFRHDDWHSAAAPWSGMLAYWSCFAAMRTLRRRWVWLAGKRSQHSC